MAHQLNSIHLSYIKSYVLKFFKGRPLCFVCDFHMPLDSVRDSS